MTDADDAGEVNHVAGVVDKPRSPAELGAHRGNGHQENHQRPLRKLNLKYENRFTDDMRAVVGWQINNN